jgi:hypothetical protein
MLDSKQVEAMIVRITPRALNLSPQRPIALVLSAETMSWNPIRSNTKDLVDHFDRVPCFRK